MSLEPLDNRSAETLTAETWQQVLETAPDIAYVLRPDGVFLDANPRMCRLLQQSRRKLIGMKVTSSLERDQVALAERILHEIAERKTPIRSTRTYHLASSDAQTFEIMESPLVRDGKVWAIAGIGREITQEVALEHKLWDSAESRQSAIDFALRTSLGLVKGYIYTLGQDTLIDAERRARYTRIVADEIDNLARIVEDLLDMRRLEGGQWDVTADIVNLRDCADIVSGQCREEAARRSIELVMDVPAEMHPLYVPREALMRVLYNVVQNGIQHTLHSGKVTLSVVDQEAYVEIVVSDNGVGIPEAELPFIFEKYYRGTSSAAATAQGTGLGLAISRLLVEAMGGKICARSKIGDGSEFRIVLPRRMIDMEQVNETSSWRPSSVEPNPATCA